MKLNMKQRRSLAGWCFVSPWVLGGLVLLVFPLGYSLVLSFIRLKNNGWQGASFAGWAHYQKAFVSDSEFVPKFLAVVKDTLINTPMILIVSLLIAIMLSRDIKARGFFRTIFFLPVLLGTGFVMEQILGQNVDQQAMEVARGILLPPQVQGYLGPDVTGYILEFFNRITMVMWKSGVQIIIALAGLQGISASLYESGRVDGATEWEMFWKITLPMMSPILLLNTVYTIVVSMTDSGGIVDYIVAKAFNSTPIQFEYSAALGWIYFAFILLLVLAVFLVFRPFVNRAADNKRG